MPIKLTVTTYRFTYQAIDKINLPDYSGTLWHSVLGKALHDISCIAPNAGCEGCMFLKQCDYRALFKGILPNHRKPMKRYKSIPTPHIIRAFPLNASQVNSGAFFSVDISLLGSINQKLPSLIRAMQWIGKNGFGDHRQKAQLTQAVQKIPNGIDRAIILQGNSPQLGMTIRDCIPESPHKLRIALITPFRHSGEAASSSAFLLDKFIMSLVRRISLLQSLYDESELDVDYNMLKQLTLTLPIIQQATQWRINKSLLNRGKQHNQAYGWTGYIDIDLQKHQALWPFLFLGQRLNVGKNASMGFGQYQLIDLGLN